MADYCSSTDIQNRFTRNGFKWVGDRNRDGSVTPDEATAYIASAIQYAGSIVDESVHAFIAPEAARAAQNPWLRDRAVDIAVWYAASQGGRDCPEVFATAYQDALTRLASVKGGDRVPGLIYPSPPFSHSKSARFPRVVNPKF